MAWPWEDFSAAVSSVVAAVIGAVGGFYALRRKISSDTAAITEDKAGSRMLLTAMAERDAAGEVARQAMNARIEDAKLIVRLETKVAVLEERIAQDIIGREKQFGACEERVRSLSERVLDLQMANGRLFAQLSIADKEAAERLLVTHLRPGPPGKGDEPP